MSENTTEPNHSYDEKGAAELRKQLHHAVALQTKAGIEVCKLLYFAKWGTTKVKGQELALAVAWGWEDFDDFAEHEMGIHQGTAHIYAGVYDELFIRRAMELQHNTGGILPHSITKLKKLARLSRKPTTDVATLKKWIGKAREMSCCEFENAIDSEIEGKSKRKNVGFSMKWGQAKIVYQALKSAKEHFGVHSNGEALAKIAQSWSSSAGWNAQRSAKPAAKSA